jgi:hypothetical protein
LERSEFFAAADLRIEARDLSEPAVYFLKAMNPLIIYLPALIVFRVYRAE